MKYHINPETNRPNKCTATKRACPVGGAHFESKADASASIEQTAAMENDLIPVAVKKEPKAASAQEIFNALSPEDQAELMDLLRERREEKAANAELVSSYRDMFKDQTRKLVYLDSLTSEVKDSVEGYAERYQRGCNGCQPPRDDYCRCAKYHPHPIGLNASGMARSMLNSLSPSSQYLYEDATPSPAQKAIIRDLTDRIERAGLDNPNLYEVEAYRGYYGEEFKGIELTVPAEAKFEQLHREFEKLFD